MDSQPPNFTLPSLFGTTAPASTAPSLFSFGQSPAFSAPAAQPNTSTSLPGFSFSSPSSFQQPAPNAILGFGLGGTQSTFGVPAASTASPFSLNLSSTTQQTSGSVFSRLGASQPAQTTPAPFSFGTASTSLPTATVAPLFSGFNTQPQPAVAITTAAATFPSFGFATTSVVPVSTPAPPAFNWGGSFAAQPTPAANPSFPTPVTTSASISGFSSGFTGFPSFSSPSSFQQSATSTTSGFGFGASSSVAAPVATTTSSFSLNLSNPTQQTSGGVFSRLGTSQPAPAPAPFSFGPPPATSASAALPTATVAPLNFSSFSQSQPSVPATTAPTFPTLSFGPATTAPAPVVPVSTSASSGFNFGTSILSQPTAPLNLSIPAPTTTTTSTASTSGFSLGLLSTAPTNQPVTLSSNSFSLPSFAPIQATTAETTVVPASTFVMPQYSTGLLNLPPTNFGLNFGPSVTSQPITTPVSTAVTTVVSTSPGSIPSVVQTSQDSQPTIPSLSTVPVTSATTSIASSTLVPATTSDVNEEDKKLLDRFKKMTYEDFDIYLEDTKRAIDQLEENWIQGTLKLNAFLSMRKENTKAMRLLREKIASIWEFENKVERTVAAVSLSVAEIDETLTYLEKHITDPEDFFKKNARRISAEDRYRANCYKTLDMLYREVRIALNDVDSSRKKLMKNLIKEDEVRNLLTSKQMLSGQVEPHLLMENPHILGTIAAIQMKEIKEVKNAQRQALTKLRFQKAQSDAQSR